MTRLFGTVFLLGALTAAPRVSHAALDEVIGKDAGHTEMFASSKLRVRVTGNLRELATSDGKIFAATWTGITNLRALLGPHWTAYETAVRTQRSLGHHLLSFSTPELTMRVVAHGRTMEGRVALTRSLPKGVTVDALH